MSLQQAVDAMLDFEIERAAYIMGQVEIDALACAVEAALALSRGESERAAERATMAGECQTAAARIAIELAKLRAFVAVNRFVRAIRAPFTAEHDEGVDV